MELAIEAGDFAGALKLHNTLQGLKGVEQHHMIMRVGSVYEGSIGGHLRRACAAGDAAAVAQLERLAGFARHTFFSIKLTLQQPELLRNLLGGFHGRAVTPGTLAAELGLPWALLQRLLMQRADTIQAQFADSRTPEAQQVQRDELLEAVQHTLMLAQDQAPGSSAADLARAKAVLAGVVAAKQLLVGAKVLHRDCLRQVQRLGDVDLLALVVLWGHRLPQAGV
ncbi:hypothetical protein OEZ86_000985 [Tetradesmus obliquus]|nr:hypothetical protein OEZ86_000985 [Tetradesmus obliquus]